MNRRPRVLSRATGMGNGIAVLLVVCAVVGCALSAAPVSRPTSQAQPADATANVWLIFIDDLHLDFTATGRLKELFKKVATELVHEGDRFGVVSTGPSAIAIDLTRDRGRLSQALDQMAGAALRPSEILADPDRDPSEVRYRAHVSFSTAYSVMQMLALVPDKRKAFIYISNGYYLDLSSGTSSQPARVNPFLGGGDAISLERLRAEAAELSASGRAIECADLRYRPARLVRAAGHRAQRE